MSFSFVSHEVYPEDQYVSEAVVICLDGKYRVTYLRKKMTNGGMFWDVISASVKIQGEKKFLKAFQTDSNFLRDDIIAYLNGRSWDNTAIRQQQGGGENKSRMTCPFDMAACSANGLNSHRDSIGDRNEGKMNRSKVKDEIASNSKRRANFSISQNSLYFYLPIRTKSEANCSEHWRIQHKRHKMQKDIIYLALKPHRSKLRLPCHIHLIRYAPRTLDKFENLPCSFKYIVDALCAVITDNYTPGRADNNKDISISCDQIKSNEYGISIEITF